MRRSVPAAVPRMSLATAPPSERELRGLADLTRDALVLFDLGGEVVALNAAAERLLAPRMQAGWRLDAWQLFAEQADAVRRLAAGCGAGPILQRRRVASVGIALEVSLHRLPEGRFALTAVDVTDPLTTAT